MKIFTYLSRYLATLFWKEVCTFLALTPKKTERQKKAKGRKDWVFKGILDFKNQIYTGQM